METPFDVASALLPYIPVSARRLLDCACGDGSLSRLIKARTDVTVAGLAHDTEAAGAAETILDQVFPVNLECGELPDIKGPFDCIVCAGLIARLRDPKPFLTWLALRLSPDGLLLVTAPNLQHFSAVMMIAEGRWTHGGCAALDRRNLRFFTAYELLRLLRETGFDPRKCLAWHIAPEEDWPLDAEGYYRSGRIALGPLNDEEYKAFRCEEYLVLATRAKQ